MRLKPFFIIRILLLSPLVTSAQLADGLDKFLGNVIDNTYHTSYLTYWNQVTPGNAGKWGSVEGSQNNYNWTNLDVAFRK